MIVYQDSSEICFRVIKPVAKNITETHSFTIPAGETWIVDNYRLTAAPECFTQLVWDITGTSPVVLDSTYSDTKVDNIPVHNKLFQLIGDGTKQLGLRMTVNASTARNVGGYIYIKKLH